MVPMKKMHPLIFSLLLFCSAIATAQSPVVFKTTTGKVDILSDAPLEVINAYSNELRGVIDTSNHSFAFTISVMTIKGFNGPLQREHFQENYMESHLYPVATFTGKIIEVINYSVAGTYEVRAKGVLNIHGVRQECIIKATINITPEGVDVQSKFNVTLIDHGIKIPRIVYQKIAPEITVTIGAKLIPEQRK